MNGTAAACLSRMAVNVAEARFEGATLPEIAAVFVAALDGRQTPSKDDADNAVAVLQAMRIWP